MRRTIALTVLVALAALAGACAKVCWGDNEARATAIRYVSKLSSLPAGSTFYVAVDGAAPSPKFFNCLPGEDSMFVPATAATHDFFTMHVRDGADRDRITLWVDDYDQTSEDRATIHAGYQTSDGTGERFRLKMRRDDGRWVVTGPG